MSQDHHAHSITIVRHIPSGTQFVLSDSVAVTDSWDDATDYMTHFAALDAKANAIVETWTNPAKRAAGGEERSATPSPVMSRTTEEPIEQADTSAILKAAEEAIHRTLWKAYSGGSEAEKLEKAKTEPGWGFADREAAPVARWIRDTGAPWVIESWAYSLSKDGVFVQRKPVAGRA